MAGRRGKPDRRKGEAPIVIAAPAPKPKPKPKKKKSLFKSED